MDFIKVRALKRRMDDVDKHIRKCEKWLMYWKHEEEAHEDSVSLDGRRKLKKARASIQKWEVELRGAEMELEDLQKGATW